MPTPTQQPDSATGVRYAKAYKYAFVMLKHGEHVGEVDPSDSVVTASDLVNDGRFVVLTLPQQLSLREPYATVVTVMQDGGKVIESRGHVLKMGSISGTTGFLPNLKQAAFPLNPPYGALIPNNPDLDTQLGALSGYLAFMKLRYLFRLYGETKRAGDITTEMHFFDYKNDDFWRIEPESFDMSRSSRKPMSYDYNIGFKCIEYSDTTIGQSRPDVALSVLPRNVNPPPGTVLLQAGGKPGVWPKQSLIAATSRFSDMVNTALNFLNFCDAVVQRSLQNAINQLDTVVGFFQAANDAFYAQLDMVPSLLAQVSAALGNLFFTFDEFAPDNIAQELNAWALEVQVLVDHMSVQVGILVASQPSRDINDTNTRFAQGRMKQGATTDLMQEPAGGAGSPDANPFIGQSGLNLVTDVDSLANGTQHTTIVIQTGEDIYALARRVLGSITRFYDLVLLNRLEFPFIVADPTQKPPNTLAWGDSVLVPVTATTSSTSTIAGAADSSAVPTTAGTVTTSSLPSQLIDDTASWMVDQWVGYSITATTGGSTQTLICNGNTATQLTLNGNWTITITPGTTTYAVTYNVFVPRRPITPEALAYGTDFLVVFGNDGRCDFALGPTGDFAYATGIDNFFQAMTLRARCPVGQHPFHRSYGLPAPVGRPMTDNVFALSSFFIRRSLLADPRVGKVRNVQFTTVGDTMNLNAEIQPIDSRIARPISIKVGT
jgi:hypothetical protein